MDRGVRTVTIALLGLLFAVVVYRAATQSLTHDEALSYQLFVAMPLWVVFGYYDPNNHFLLSLLVRLTTTLFGSSELTVRLPTVLGCAAYFFVVYRLLFLLFGGRLWLPLAALVMTANPLLLDMLVAARGYGLAVAMFWLGFWQLFTYATSEKPRRAALIYGGVGLSCAVMANMSLLLPAAVLSGLFLATLPQPAPVPESKKKSRHKKVPPARSRFSEARYFIGTVLACAFLYWLGYPLHRATSKSFYSIRRSLSASAADLVRSSFAYSEGMGAKLSHTLRGAWVDALAFLLLPGVLLGALAACWKLRGRTPAKLLLLWSTVVTVGSLALHVVTNFLFRWPYPADRTGVYLFPLVGMSLVSLIAVLRETGGRGKYATMPLGLLAVAISVSYLSQFNTGTFYVWGYDADNRQIVERLGSLRGNSDRVLDVGISWQLEPSFNYYRKSRNLSWLPKFDRRGPRSYHDYYVLARNDQDFIRQRGLKVLYTGLRSGTVLAAGPDVKTP